MNFAPDGEWVDKENRMRRVLTFMEQRHLLALARQHNEDELAQPITKKNRFYIRLTNMIRELDPTSKVLMNHYQRYWTEEPNLANLIVNVVFLRNTMSK